MYFYIKPIYDFCLHVDLLLCNKFQKKKIYLIYLLILTLIWLRESFTYRSINAAMKLSFGKEKLELDEKR